jgi:hypothetical protein
MSLLKKQDLKKKKPEYSIKISNEKVHDSFILTLKGKTVIST